MTLITARCVGAKLVTVAPLAALVKVHAALLVLRVDCHALLAVARAAVQGLLALVLAAKRIAFAVCCKEKIKTLKNLVVLRIRLTAMPFHFVLSIFAILFAVAKFFFVNTLFLRWTEELSVGT